MSKCVAAGFPVGVVACVMLAVSPALAQDNSASEIPGSEAPAQQQATPAGEVPLPDLVVSTSNKPKKAKKAKKQSTGGGGSGSADADEGVLASQGSGDAAASSDEPLDGVVLGGAVADTGMTVFDTRSVNMRTDGGGDANTFMRNLPNVQYQNDANDNAGINGYQAIDTRPLLLSINGAQTYENNFIVNGVSTNNVTGAVDPFNTDALNSDTGGNPNLNSMYGLHPQTVFVPSDFIGTATIIDSNASAEYGEFLGGVVIYDLARPPTDRYRASLSYRRHTHEMVDYLNVTPTGTNPLGKTAPKFTQESLAASIGAPITTDLSFIVQASRKTGDTTRQKQYTYFNGVSTEDSENIFLRFATELKTDIGRFTFDTSLTDYQQVWTSMSWRDMEMNVATRTSSTQLEYLGALTNVANENIGLNNVTLKSRVYYNDSETLNETNSNVAYSWIAKRRVKPINGTWGETFSTEDYADWCQSDPISTLGTDPTRQLSNNTVCNIGGYGNKETGQTDYGVQAQLRGNIFLGNFLIGGEAKTIDGRRARPDEFVWYTSVRTSTGETQSPAGGEFFCPAGDDACTSDQYGRIKTVSPAFEISETVNALHGYAEIDQTLGWFNVRAGTRLDYEDYFKNVNIAPRLAATVSPFDGISLTGGYNRYYIGETLYYALRDSQPYSLAYTRSHTANGTVSSTWTPPATIRRYGFKSLNLDTPFNDEYTGTLRVRDPLLNGNARLRYTERHGEDLFTSASCGSNCTTLTNDGESFYRSVTAEYTKFWRDLPTQYLNGAGFTVGATWSEQNISRGTYVDDDESDVFILYKGQSYTPLSFVDVTGNLDIPVRIGGTLSTNWFNNMLVVDLSAGYNLGYQGVYDTGTNVMFNDRVHDVYDDRKFKAVLKVDLAAYVAVTEQAYIKAHVNNIFNTPGNAIATYENPWMIGRSFWLESGLRF
ncbi:hypothetical protein [Hyphomicrobium sulfonivorans]|uniref:hypothetical protein n=1 Tax=Hyphomicrobium sulfonivorans TaxID=121290 RepID=UPI00156DD44D|nr:hypothetical protein [Hyphomicrobium sulfonivorans]MBI1651373.1 hypothetical protein [Hyphomicrobium sulfonivorans]NSL73304.1 hypothetical protein [Hyphomicrobium sulfonivorans]